MKRLILVLLALCLPLLPIPEAFADSCFAPKGTKLSLIRKDQGEEYAKIQIRSLTKRCRSTARASGKSLKKYGSRLNPGRYRLNIKAAGCNSLKKRIKIDHKSIRISFSLSCQKLPVSEDLLAKDSSHILIPNRDNLIQLDFSKKLSEVPEFKIVTQPKYGAIKSISPEGLVVLSVGQELEDDLFSFSIRKGEVESNTATIRLLSPRNGGDLLLAIIDQKLITEDSLNTHLKSLTFEEIFLQLGEESLDNLLRNEGALTTGASIRSLLLGMGLDSSSLKLNSGGLLTAAYSLSGVSPLGYLGASKPFQELLHAAETYNYLNFYFNENKIAFINYLSPLDLQSILFTNKGDFPASDPIFLVSNELIPFYLGGSESEIVRRIAISLNFETGAKADSWSIPTLVNVVRGIEDSRRVFFVTFGSGNAVAALDPLVDGSGAIIEKFPGVPYRFPSYQAWGERVKGNLTNYLLQIAAEFNAKSDSSSPAKYVAIDFESIRNDWESTVLYFQGAHELLLLDPRTQQLKADLNLTDDDLRAMDSWVPTDPRRLRWDALMLKHRADVLSYAIGGAFRDVFNDPDIMISNYDDTLRSDLVPNGAFEKKEYRIWGSVGTSLQNSAPSIPLYGLHYNRLSTPEGEILSSPPAPRVIHEVSNDEYYTRNNTFVSTLNRSNSISSATDSKTNHYVTFKEFIDTWHNGYYGPCMRFNTATKRYERQACGESEGIGNFMFEYWALASQNSKFLNLYTLSTNSLPITVEQAMLAKHSMRELNRVLGYSDRGIAKDAYVIIDGERISVGANHVPYGKPFYVWASKANGKTVYRVVFMAPNGFDKASTVLRDGSGGDGALLSYGGSTIEIPGGIVDEISLSDSNSPFGVFITQNKRDLKLLD